MNKSHLLGGGLTLLASFMLVACNSNDDDNVALKQVGGGSGAVTTPTKATVTVTPSLGKILNAKVTLKNAKTGATLGTGNTGNTGIATFPATKTSDPVIAEVQGAAGATYFDESKANSAPFDASQVIKVVVPTLVANANIGVSALTDIAYKAALKKAGGSEAAISAAIATASNDAIRTALAPELASITEAPSVVGSADDLAALKNTDAGKYALRLAALAKLVSSENTTPALTILAQLNADFADGTFDGIANGTAITAYTQANLQSKIQANLTSTITAANLSGFNVNAFTLGFGSIVINVGNAGGGTGANGTVCVANSSYNLVVQGIPVSQSAKYCYINFPANAGCDSSNQTLSGTVNNINIEGVTGNISWSYTSATSCPADTQVKYDYSTGQIVINS